MSRRLAGVLAFLVFSFTGLTAVTAQTATVTCGQVITQSVVLEADVGPCPGEGLVVGASDITIDLGGHTIFGAPSAGVGIRIEHPTLDRPVARVRVRNGTVTGFVTGVFVSRTADNVLERLVVRDNSCHGIQLHGLGAAPQPALRTIVRENVVRGNGCSGIHLVQRAQSSLIERNVVTGNTGAGVFLQAIGLLNSPVGNTVRQNSISGNGGDGVTDMGLENTTAGNSIRANGGNGIRLASGLTALRTVVQGNRVVDNALNGVVIDIMRGGDTTVTGNTALGNGSATGFDLADLNTECRGNTWAGNTFVTRNQPCIS